MHVHAGDVWTMHRIALFKTLLVGYSFAPKGGLVRDRILGLIQAWTDAFRGDPELSNVSSTHALLISQGVEFPAVDPANAAPIMTPQASVPPHPAASTVCSRSQTCGQTSQNKICC